MGNEVGGEVRKGVGHRAAAELGIGRRRVRVRQEAGGDGGGGVFRQVYGVREGKVWMGKLRIWVGQESVAESGKLAGGRVGEGIYR